MQKTSIRLIKLLRTAGFQSYWAGGCVRDMLLGKTPQDYDIATDAKPHEIEKILAHTIPIGKQFGVILAVEKGHHFEVATFRSDSGYSDGRRPDAVLFSSPAEDASRRDFTINALFFDPIEKKVYDYVEGIKDLQARLIRFIGNPKERIHEDHLRIIRAIRLKNTLNFGYHPDTYHALKTYHNLAQKVSADRLREELSKILQSEFADRAFEDLQDTGILRVILPEVEDMKGVAQPMMYHGEGDVWTHTMLCLKSLPADVPLNLRYATLFHDIGKPETFKLGADRIRFDGHVEAGVLIASRILKRLNFSKKDSAQILWLIDHHMTLGNYFKMTKTRRLHWFRKPEFKLLIQLFLADIKGTQPLEDHLYRRLEKLYRADLQSLPKEPKRLLGGTEIMAELSIPPGPFIGDLLNELHELQIEEKITTKKQARTWLKQKAAKIQI